jgi:hypothetical protein
MSDTMVQASVDIGTLAEGAVNCSLPTVKAECRCLTGSVSVNALLGYAKFPCLYFGSAGTGFQLRLTALGQTQVTAPFSVVPGKAATIDILGQPTRAVAGSAMDPIMLAVLDKCGNVVTQRSDTVSVSVASPANAAVLGTLSNTTTRGLAQLADVRLTYAQDPGPSGVCTYWDLPCTQRIPHTLLIAVGSLSTPTAPIFVSNAALASIEVSVQPGRGVQGVPLTRQPVIRLFDAFGNTVTQAPVPYLVSASSLVGAGCPRTCPTGCDGSLTTLGQCMRLFENHVTFQEARDSCIRWGGDLAALTSDGYRDLAKYLTFASDTWVGLNFDTKARVWSWTSDTSKQDVSSAVYWRVGDPARTGQFNCGTLNVNKLGGTWGSVDCAETHPYLCLKAGPGLTGGNCSCCERLRGSTTSNSMQGFAVFNDLYTLAEAGFGARLFFTAYPAFSSPDGAGAVFATSDPFEVLPGASRIRVVRQPGDGTSGQPLTVQPQLHVLTSEDQLVLESMHIQVRVCRSWFCCILVACVCALCACLHMHNSQVRVHVSSTSCMHNTYIHTYTGPRIIRILSIHTYTHSHIHTQVRASLTAGGSSTMRGNAQVQVIRGIATFTDLVVDMPPGAVTAGLALDFTASVGTSVLRTKSRPFLTLQRSAAIQIVIGPRQNYRAGNLVGDMMLKMLDDKGNPVLNSNTDVHASLLAEDGSVVTLTALRGTSTVIATRGQANYTDLVLTQAGTFRLLFSAPFINLTTRSEPFTVTSAPFAGVQIVTQPMNTTAGLTTSVRVMLTDEFGNLNATSGVALRLNAQSANGDCCAGQIYTAITAAGFVNFNNVIITVARDDLYVVAGIVFEESACLDQPSPDDVATCPLRRDARSMSRRFRVDAAEAARVEVTQGVSTQSVAGEAFAVQPKCAVFDRYNNRVTNTYKVTASVLTRSGEGCVCDFEKNDLCDASSTVRTLQVCVLTSVCVCVHVCMHIKGLICVMYCQL